MLYVCFCEEHGVILKIEYVSDSSYNEGSIFEQNKPEGYTIMSGTTLKIKVAKAAEENTDTCNPLEEECETEDIE